MLVKAFGFPPVDVCRGKTVWQFVRPLTTGGVNSEGVAVGIA